MHELGIVSGVLDTVRNTVRHEHAVRALEVRLRIGDMAQVVSESLDFAWDVLCDEDPITAGCALVVEEVHPRSRCLACGNEFDHDCHHFRCPACGSGDTTLLAGRELDIVSIEIEDDDDAAADASQGAAAEAV